MNPHFLIRTFIISLFILSSAILTEAQQTYFLTLDSAIAIAKEKSPRMRILQETLNQATYRVKSINRSFLPSITLNGYAPDYSDDIVRENDSLGVHYYSAKRRLYSGNIEIGQQLPTAGKLYIKTGVQNEDEYLKTSSGRSFDVYSKIQFDQPIEALYSYNSMQASLKQAKLNFELASKEYKREELDLIYNISSIFYTVISSEKQKEIAYQSFKRQEEAYKMAKNKYETGLIKEVEALQMEVDLGEATNQYDLQITNCQQNANQLKKELGLSLADSIITSNKLEYKIILIDQVKAIEMAMKNRTEIREKQIQISLSELDIKRQKAQGTITGKISAYYSLSGYSQFGIDEPYGSAFRNSYETLLDRPANKGIAFSFSIPILDWGSNHQMVKLYKSQLQQNKLSLDYQYANIENEVKNTISQFNSSLRRLQLLEKNVKLAEKSFEISYLRFTNGDIDAEALGLDRIRYNTAQQSQLDAYISYKMLLLDLNRKTFYDFENNVSLVPESTQ
jgi:outer membrane protein